MGGKNTNPTPVKEPKKEKRAFWNKLKSSKGSKKSSKSTKPQGNGSQPQVTTDPAKEKWEKALDVAQFRLNTLGKKQPARDCRRPANILNVAKNFAKGKQKDGYEKATTLLEKEFDPAIDLSEKDGQQLEPLYNKVNEEILAFEQDMGKLGKAEELEKLLGEAKSKLNTAKTPKDVTAVRRQLKRAAIFKPVPVQEDTEDVKNLKEVLEKDKPQFELAEAKMAWESAHDEAAETLVELKSLGEFCPHDSVQELLKQAEGLAKPATTKAYQDGTNFLKNQFKSAAAKARETATQTKDAQDKAGEECHRAELGLAEVESLTDYLDVKEVDKAGELFGEALDALATAKTAEAFNKVLPLAKTALDKINELLGPAKNALATEKNYEKALSDAEKDEKTLAALPSAGTFLAISKPLDEIRQAITAAKEVVKKGPKSIGAFTEGIIKLDGVAEKTKSATEAADAATEVLGKLKDTEDGLVDLKKYPFIDGTAVEDLIKEARSLLAKANDAKQAEQAAGPLNKAAIAIEELRKANEAKLKFFKIAEAEEIKAKAHVRMLGRLPGAAQFGPLHHLIEGVQKSLKTAQDDKGKASDIDKLKNVIAKFQAVSNKGDQAKALSAEAGKLGEEKNKATQALEAMKSLSHADVFGPLTHFIDGLQRDLDVASKAADDKAAQATDIKELSNEIVTLQTFGGQKTDFAKDLSTQAGKLYAEVEKADKIVAELEKHGFLKDGAKPLREAVDAANNLLMQVTELDKAQAAVQPLKDLDKAATRLLEPQDQGERKEIERKLEERKKYDQLRVEAVTLISEARKLRGVDTDKDKAGMVKLIKDMDDILAGADKKAKAALTWQAIQDAGLEFAKLDELKGQAEKRAEVLKKESEENLKARTRFEKVLAAAELAATKAASMPAGSEYAGQIRLLITRARLTMENDPEHGHGKALEPLDDKAKGYKALLKQAKKANKKFKPDPQVAKQQKEVEGIIDVFAKFASEDTVLLYKAEVATALEKSVKDPTGAIDDLKRIASDIKQVSARLGNEEKEARKALEDVKQQLAIIRDYAPKATVQRIETAITNSNVEFQSREWVLAHERLHASLEEVKEWAKRKTDYDGWQKKAPDLQRMLDRSKVIAEGWPPLSSTASKLQGQFGNLKTEIGQSGDFKEGLAKFGELEKEYTLLDEEAKKQTPSKDGKAVDLEALAQARKEGSKRVTNARNDVDMALRDFAQLPQMVGVKNKEKLPVYIKHSAILEDWNKFIADVSDQGAVSVDEILKRADKAVTDFKELQKRLERTQNEPLALQLELKDHVKEINEIDEEEARQRLDAKVAELGRHGVNVTGEQSQLEEAFKEAPVDQKKLRNLQDDLDKKLGEAGQELKKSAEEGKKQADQFRKQLAKVPWGKRKFKEYYKKLNDKVDDLDALFQSGDVDLIRQGMKDLAAMKEVMEKDKKDPKGKRFNPVQKKWKMMGKTLGKDNLVRKRLKATYNRLKKEHEAAIAKAMESDPEQSLKDLEPLSKKIDEAVQEAEKVNARYKEFKAQHKALIESHKKLTKETRTWITEKCDAFTKRFETRLGAAKTLAKTEGSMDEAFKAVADLRKELEDIRSKPNPREELQKKNGEAAQEQRMARDLARQFEADKDGFEKLADKAEEVVKKADKNDGQVSRLRKAADGAAKGVEPYLKTFSKQDADPPEQVIQAFTQARKQLAELSASLRRLIENPASTEVADPDELVEIEKEFRLRCRKLVTGVQDLLGKVKSAPVEAAQWPQENKAPTPEEIGKTIVKMEGYFKDIGERFTAKRLVAPLKVLKESPDEKIRKGAREKALREVHRMTQDLLKDDILKELRKNPYRKLTTETSLLRASLKSLELAVLVGI